MKELTQQLFDQLIQVMEWQTPVSTPAKIELTKQILVIDYTKGTRIQHFMQIPDHLWFLAIGTAKEVCVNKETKEECVTWFWQANDFLFTEPGLFNEMPADAYIELLEDCTLLYLPYAKCIGLYNTFPELKKFLNQMRGEFAAARKVHQVSIATEQVKYNFQKLRNTHPSLFNVARHKDILEFIGSTDDSFRRFM